MTFYSKESKTIGFVVYAGYGLMSHVIMNNYGAVFGINPIVDENHKAVIYPDKASAELAKTDFHNYVSEVILVTQFERDGFVHS